MSKEVWFVIQPSAKGDFVYCEVMDDYEGGILLLSGTLDYCIEHVTSLGWKIANAHGILMQVHKAGTEFRI